MRISRRRRAPRTTLPAPEPSALHGQDGRGEGPSQKAGSDAKCDRTASRNVVRAATGIPCGRQQLPEAHGVPVQCSPGGVARPTCPGPTTAKAKARSPSPRSCDGDSSCLAQRAAPGVPRRHGKAVSLEAHENLPGSAEKSKSQHTDQPRCDLGREGLRVHGAWRLGFCDGLAANSPLKENTENSPSKTC